MSLDRVPSKQVGAIDLNRLPASDKFSTGGSVNRPYLRAAAIFAAIICIVVQPVLLLAETDQEVEARKEALDLAGAFSNDGFKIRDGHWSGMIKPHEHTVIAVNLYAGNHYWFSVGATERAKKLAITVYDETGQQVATESYDSGQKLAAGFSPTNSGQYYVSVGLVEGEESGVCFLYSYK